MTALAVGCSLVLYDGSPLHPHTGVMWDLAKDGHIGGQYDRRELKRKLYRAILNLLIMRFVYSLLSSILNPLSFIRTKDKLCMYI